MRCPRCGKTRFYLSEEDLMCTECGYLIPHNQNLDMYPYLQLNNDDGDIDEHTAKEADIPAPTDTT